MRRFYPYSDFSGTLQKDRLFIDGPRQSILVKLEDQDRSRVLKSLSEISAKEDGENSQWLLSHLAHLPVCYITSDRGDIHATKKKFPESYLNYVQESWEFRTIQFDPIPFYSWFRFAVTRYEYPIEPYQKLIIKNPNDFLQVAKIHFSQSKYLANILERILEDGEFIPAIDQKITDLVAYFYTIKNSIDSLSLGENWQDLVMGDTKKLGSLLLGYRRQEPIQFLCHLEIASRIIFLDDHPVKVLLKEMLSIQLFKPELKIVELNGDLSEVSMLLNGSSTKGLMWGFLYLNACRTLMHILKAQTKNAIDFLK